MDPALLRHLEAANPWLREPASFLTAVRHRLPEPFLPRRVPGAERWPERGKAHLIVGARQAGKSTFLWQRFAAAGTAPLFLDASEPLVRAWCKNPTLALADLRGLVGPEVPVFLDEAQHLDEAGLFVKGLVDGGLESPLYVTGSGAFHLGSRTRESLAGRAVRVVLHPFSLEEVTAGLDTLPPLLRGARVEECVERQLVTGSYPEAWLGGRPEETLYHLVQSVVLRDASDLYRIERPDALATLLRLAAGQVGSLVNLSEWASVCGVARGTVANYLELLVESHVLRLVRPFAGGRRAELVRLPKVFFCDNGLRNAALGLFQPWETRPDRGALMENWVAAELGKRLAPLDPVESLHFWRTKSGAEVDLVLVRGRELLPIEVKAGGLAGPRLSRSARSFIQAYRPERFLVVCSGPRDETRVGDTLVRWVGAGDLAGPEAPAPQRTVRTILSPR